MVQNQWPILTSGTTAGRSESNFVEVLGPFALTMCNGRPAVRQINGEKPSDMAASSEQLPTSAHEYWPTSVCGLNIAGSFSGISDPAREHCAGMDVVPRIAR